MGCGQSITAAYPIKKQSFSKIKKRHRRFSDNETSITFVEASSERDKQLVRRTWRLMAVDLAGNGSKVFLRIFELRPELKQLFPFRDVIGDELMKNPTFKGHASRFMQAVGAAVDNIDDWEAAFSPLLLGLGRQHINFGGFKPEYFNAFADSMMFIWEQVLGDRFTTEARCAWQGVFEFIMLKLKEGYAEADTERNDNQNAKV
ncbi:hypothetical protein FSP39_003494 [Pinctada imbricata]|uniref:Globin domain-containing protein n=1 Tax=Pinctada imbricata TaxID=66713 RepID=A0AA88Y8U7_PINIB|nr:hypothetical protein FSP39_003494 [Pinctada imbricata]